ncbi:MAG: putative manganese transporter [Candidatus Marinimicrobia bacterium]|nr:putative manganese transporter [Candidatus Neomarinimicrobiota bacterium]
MNTLLPVLKHALSISFFVFVMMLVVEYFNVISKGKWEAYFCRQKGWMQYFLAAILGVMPGCLGAFAAVTLYSHRMFSLGAIVATMIATSGDEAFVMFAMFPGKALLISIILFGIAMISGWLVDRIFKTGLDHLQQDRCEKMVIHDSNIMPLLPGWKTFRSSWSESTRVILLFGLLLFISLLAAGILGPQIWNWKRITFMLVGVIGIWIVASSSKHFIHDHLWKHVTREHLPALFAWTFAALWVIHYTNDHMDLAALIEESRLQVTILSALVGIIPSSGPHLLFVTLFSKELIPLSTLVVSSIVQDGHGMLPLLAFSRLDFLKVKGINLIVGILVGIIWLVLAA